MPDRDGRGDPDDHVLPQPHVPVRRWLAPVDEPEVQVVLGGSRYGDGHDVRLRAETREGADVELEVPERSNDVLRGRDLRAVDPDIGAIADATEVEPYPLPVIPLRKPEGGAIPPRMAEALLRNIPELRPGHQVRVFPVLD